MQKIPKIFLELHCKYSYNNIATIFYNNNATILVINIIV